MKTLIVIDMQNDFVTGALGSKEDEDHFGFTYEALDRYIRTGEIDDEEVKTRIDTLHQKNLFKLQLMPKFHYECE